jgi:hypothetical protein
MLIGEGTTQLHHTLRDEGIHDRRVLGEPGLLAQW